MRPIEARLFYYQLFGWLGTISESFHTSLLELMDTGIIEIFEIFPIVIKSRNEIKGFTDNGKSGEYLKFNR